MSGHQYTFSVGVLFCTMAVKFYNLLFRKPWKVTVTTKHSREAALLEAALNGLEECVKVLLNKGANVNARNNYGQTALHCAIKKGHFACYESAA